MHYRLGAALLFAALLAAPAVSAHQRVHEHGHWQLNAAIDGAQLQIELYAPGMDVVGFEHQARTAEEKTEVRKAREMLEAANALFILPANAGCVLEEAHADVAGMDHGGHSAEKHQDAAHGHQDEHRDNHAKHDAETHSEYRANYVFTCSDITQLNTIGVAIFDSFPRAETIEAAVLTAKGQRAAQLDKESPAINLSGLH